MLAWIGNLDFAAGTGGFTPAVAEEGKRRGAPRKRYWWEEDRFYLPPHTRDELLPHEAALEDAKTELQEVKRTRSAGKAELRSLAGQLGNITKSARALERRIETATEVADLEDRYRSLGTRISSYMDKLDAAREEKRRRIEQDDERIINIIMKLDG